MNKTNDSSMSIESKNEISIAKIQTNIEYMKSDIQEIKTDIKSFKDGFVLTTTYLGDKKINNDEHAKFVTADVFRPYQIILGIIGSTTLIAIVGWFLDLVKPR